MGLWGSGGYILELDSPSGGTVLAEGGKLQVARYPSTSVSSTCA